MNVPSEITPPKVIQIVSRQPLTTCPLLHENKKKETDTEKEELIYYGGFVIAVRNNSFINYKQHYLEPTQ